jgi:pimeloyl-ACP methyl ester carboxylesterase
MNAAVVYVHGLWFSGQEAFMLRRRLEKERGYAWHSFSYASTLLTMDAIADALDQFIATVEAPRVHLVGHSLGGIVIMRTLSLRTRAPGAGCRGRTAQQPPAPLVPRARARHHCRNPVLEFRPTGGEFR